MRITPRMILAVVVILVIVGYGLITAKSGGPHISIGKKDSCQVMVLAQQQDGNSCSIKLGNGTTLPLTCDQLPYYPAGSEISVNPCNK